MKLDKQPPTTTVPSDPLAASGKPKKWANVRRKFALIVANRNSGTHHHHHHHSHHSHHPPPDEEAASQAESFCRPYIQNGGAGLLLRAADREPDREMEFAQVTKENSERNKEITSPLYSAPKSTATAPKRKKKGPRKIVRFIEEPYVILDQEDSGSIDSREEEADVDVDVGVDVDVDTRAVMAGVKALQLRTGSGPATIRVVRQ